MLHTHIHHFVTHNPHTTLSQIPFTHNFVTHTTLSHKTLPHNFVTDSFHTQLRHTTLSHTTTHNSFNTQLFHTQFCNIHLFHIQSFTHKFVTYNSFTHNTFTYTNLHTGDPQHCHTHSSFTQPGWLAPSPFLPAFPISYSHLLGNHWKKLTCGVARSFNFRTGDCESALFAFLFTHSLF